METIHFNTGRKYSEHGQRITAQCEGGTVYFMDHDRMVSGEFELGDAPFDAETVLYMYDMGAYAMSVHAMSIQMPQG